MACALSIGFMLIPKSEADNGDLKSEADNRPGYKAPPEAGKWEHKETPEHSNQDPSPESTERSPGKGNTRGPETPPAEKAQEASLDKDTGQRKAKRQPCSDQITKDEQLYKASGWSQSSAT